MQNIYQSKVTETSFLPSSETIKDIKLSSNIKFDLDFWKSLSNGYIRKNSLDEHGLKVYEQIKILAEQLILKEFQI